MASDEPYLTWQSEENVVEQVLGLACAAAYFGVLVEADRVGQDDERNLVNLLQIRVVGHCVVGVVERVQYGRLVHVEVDVEQGAYEASVVRVRDPTAVVTLGRQVADRSQWQLVSGIVEKLDRTVFF